MSPRVSVVVPVHDAEDTLERCVSSLLGQTLEDVEVVLVDDGSTDGSAAICTAFVEADQRVVAKRQDGAGVSRARNAGVQIAQGEFVTFMDADDWAEPEMLSAMLDAAKTTGADVVVAGCIVDFSDEVRGVGTSRTILPGSAVVSPEHPAPVVSDELVNLLGYAWNKLYRRELLVGAPIEFPSDVALGEDMLFNADALTSAATVVLLDKAHVHYVQHQRPTLGTSFRTDFLDLRLRSIAGVARVLEHWSIPSATVDRVTGRLQVEALRSLARTTADHSGMTMVEKSRHFRHTRRGVDGRLRTRDLPLSRRGQALALRRLPALLVMLVTAGRSRRLRGSGE